MTAPLPAAVLWDMDGTVVDTEPYWMSAETDIVAEHGGVWTDADARSLIGAGLVHTAHAMQRAGVTLGVDDIIVDLTDRVMIRLNAAIPWRPGARELVAELRAAGVPVALVTMSFRRMALQVTRAMGENTFDLVIAGDDVTNPKPHPEPYLRAAALLGVPITQCVAIEDSKFGLASAVASGAASIGVPLHVPLPTAPTYELWPTLAGRTAADLGAALGRHQARESTLANPQQ
jgi:HAD superfamily hydrolase (TIGR01509 family)